MSTERWLVTGASGQLGGHVVQQLAQESADQTILALAGRGAVGTQGIEVRRIDLRGAGGGRRGPTY